MISTHPPIGSESQVLKQPQKRHLRSDLLCFAADYLLLLLQLRKQLCRSVAHAHPNYEVMERARDRLAKMGIGGVSILLFGRTHRYTLADRMGLCCWEAATSL